MGKFVPPLTVIFIWHPDDKEASSHINYLSELFSKDGKKLFSRSVNLPVYFYTAKKNCVPPKIKDLIGKTIIFPFIGSDIMSDSGWMSYIEDMHSAENIFIVPVTLAETALNLKICENKQSIRAFSFEDLARESIFVEIAHAICMYISNKTNNGSDEPIQLFLSHTKKGEKGLKIAEALKNFIDKHRMKCFIDENNVPAGQNSIEIIENNVKKSTVIAIHTDIYSSNYWCQREILCAKQNNRPIIAVDALENFEDRRFPFAANVPSVHIGHNKLPLPPEIVFEIIKVALIETIRYDYSRLLLEAYKKIGWIDDQALILGRPPEVSDIEKIFVVKNGNIQHNEGKYNRFIYPDPPVFEEEVAFLKSLAILVETPLTTNSCNLKGKKIGVSFGYPNTFMIGQNRMHLKSLSQEIARYLLYCQATIICGGDFRKGGFTDFMYPEAQVLKGRYPLEKFHLHSYVAWPIYIQDHEKTKNWAAGSSGISNVDKVQPPPDILKLILNEDQFLTPSSGQNRFVWSRCLTEMREKMDAVCNARICAGGKLFSSRGMMPGILEEISIAGKRNLPLYLIGGFGGLTAKVCEAITTGNDPEELTEQWQIETAGYEKTHNYIKSYFPKYIIEYHKILETIRNLDLTVNGLTKEENERLFNSRYIDEVVFLVHKGLKSI